MADFKNEIGFCLSLQVFVLWHFAFVQGFVLRHFAFVQGFALRYAVEQMHEYAHIKLCSYYQDSYVVTSYVVTILIITSLFLLQIMADARRKCLNSPDAFCYICGSFTVPSQRMNISDFVKKVLLSLLSS